MAGVPYGGQMPNLGGAIAPALPTGGGTQELFSLAAQNPDTFATLMAGAGISPPAPTVGGGDIGAALTGQELGAPLTGWGATVTPGGPGVPPGQQTGVKAPTPPEVPRAELPGAPAAPRPSGSIQMGGIDALVNALTPQRPQPRGYELPSTLQRAIMGR